MNTHNDPTGSDPDPETQSRRTTLRQLATAGALMTGGVAVSTQDAEAHGITGRFDDDDAPDWDFRPAGMPHKMAGPLVLKYGWRIAGTAPNRPSKFRMHIVKNGRFIKSKTFTKKGEFTATMWTYRNADGIAITRA